MPWYFEKQQNSAIYSIFILTASNISHWHNADKWFHMPIIPFIGIIVIVVSRYMIFFFKSLSKATIVYFVCILSDTFFKKMINVNFVFKTAFALKTITLQKNDYTISFDAIYFCLLVPALLFDWQTCFFLHMLPLMQ